MIIHQKPRERELHTTLTMETQGNNNMLDFIVKEYKSAFDTVLYSSFIGAFVLNIRAWIMGLTANEALTYLLSAIAVITGFIKMVSLIADTRKANAEKRLKDMQLKDLIEDMKRKNKG